MSLLVSNHIVTMHTIDDVLAKDWSIAGYNISCVSQSAATIIYF
jgi:hypothetical protein